MTLPSLPIQGRPSTYLNPELPCCQLPIHVNSKIVTAPRGNSQCSSYSEREVRAEVHMRPLDATQEQCCRYSPMQFTAVEADLGCELDTPGKREA